MDNRTVKNRHYYNLFQAVKIFNADPDKLFVDFKSGTGIERIYQKEAVKELRFLLPQYRVFKDNKELLSRVAAGINNDVVIRQLIRESLGGEAPPEEQKEEEKVEEKKPKEESKKTDSATKRSRETTKIVQLEPTPEPSPDLVEQAPLEGITRQYPAKERRQEDESDRPEMDQNLLDELDRQTRRLQEKTPQQPSRQPEFKRPNIPQGLKRIGSNVASRAKIAGNKLANGALRGAGSVGRGILNAGGGILRGGVGGATRMAASATARAGIGALAAIGWPVIVVIIVVLIIIVMMFFLLDSSALLNQFSPASTGKTDFSTTQQISASKPVVRDAGICPSQEVIDQNKDNNCKYLNPNIDLFDIFISDEMINKYIEKYVSSFNGTRTEFIRRVDYIVDMSKQAGLNPILFLGYWKSESQFSSLGTRDMGCVGDNFEEQVNCALGIKEFSDPAKNPVANCARSGDANSIACKTLKSIRTNSPYDSTHPVKYPIATIDDFAESYGPYDHLTGGKPTNCTHTYNTLLEVASRLNACTSAPSTAPVQTGNLQQSIGKEFGITMTGFSDRQLQWAWEQLGRLSGTEFINLAGGTKIVRISGFVSSQLNCRNIEFGDYQDKTLFQVTLTHELGHIAYWCNPNESSKRSQQAIAFDQEGGVTGYAQFAFECYRSSSITEDYAEMSAYYLNPGIPEQTRCHNREQVPFGSNRFPVHYNVAGSIYGKLNL